MDFLNISKTKKIEKLGFFNGFFKKIHKK